MEGSAQGKVKCCGKLTSRTRSWQTSVSKPKMSIARLVAKNDTLAQWIELTRQEERCKKNLEEDVVCCEEEKQM